MTCYLQVNLKLCIEEKYWEGKEFQPDYSVFKRPSSETVLTTYLYNGVIYSDL